jgi:SPP1 gp7 family putative phage head morphogenesis protein
MPTKKELYAIVARVDASDIVRVTEPVIREVLVTFGEDWLERLGVTDPFDVVSADTVRYLRQYSSTRIKGMVNKTTQRQLRRALAAGVDNGETIRQLSRRVRGVFGEANRSRALTIARTEVGRASNYGSLQGMKQADVGSKEWQATLDFDVRDAHIELNGQIVGINEPFRSGLARAQYPGGFGVAALDINCRCGVLAVVDEKSAHKAAKPWKVLEAERAPWDRKLIAGLRKGFRTQQAKVLAALAKLEDAA